MEKSLTAEVTENPPEYFISSAPHGLVYKDKPLCVKDTELRQGRRDKPGSALLCSLTRTQSMLSVEVGNGICARLGSHLMWSLAFNS